jgi:hypothetical protein
MKITMIATDQITRLDGVQVRVWEGVTERGIPCKVFVHRVAVRENQNTADFDRELKEQMPPGRLVDFMKVL